MKRVSLKTEAAKGEKIYSPSKTYVMSGRLEEKEPFDREAWLKSKYEIIFSTDPKLVYLQYSHVMDMKDGILSWNEDKIKSFDDVQLTFICNVINNTINLRS